MKSLSSCAQPAATSGRPAGLTCGTLRVLVEEEESPLAGGNVAGTVVRVGNTVRRPAGPWTPAVQALLAHLDAVGFRGAPRPMGIDDRGREVLTFAPGIVPWPDRFDLLDPANQLTRVSASSETFTTPWRSFTPPPDSYWQRLIPPEGEGIIAHHDLAPWNLIMGDDWVLIDWDSAGPGSRLWDIAYAVHGFVPAVGRRAMATPGRRGTIADLRGRVRPCGGAASGTGAMWAVGPGRCMTSSPSSRPRQGSHGPRSGRPAMAMRGSPTPDTSRRTRASGPRHSWPEGVGWAIPRKLCQGCRVAGRVIGHRYRLQSVLGRGGMAEVWQGLDERLDRPVAVKLLHRRGLADPTVVARFDREARAVARLSHPNIVAVYDVGVDKDMPYLVMELVRGQSLAARIGNGSISVSEATNVAAQVCDALQAAHDAGIVHRDVKPANILIQAAGSVKVCDFGIARVSQATQAGLTRSHITVGTAEYMAPEQATGGSVDARTDLYALGCVLYAMLAGSPPFHGDSALAVMWQHVNQPVVPVASLRPDVPGGLGELIGRLLAKNPDDRPATAREVRERLASRAARPTRSTATAAAAVAPVVVPVRAKAAVVTPTRSMPALDSEVQPAAAAGRFRVGPAGIAAVAVGAAMVAAIAAAMYTSQRPGPPADQAIPPAAVSPSAPDASETVPGNGVAAVEATIQAQIVAGALDEDAAEKLTNRLEDVAKEVEKGDLDEAADKARDVRDELRDLRRDDELTNAGYAAILASLDDLTRSLSRSDGGNN